MLCNEAADDLHKKIARYQDGLILSYKNDDLAVFCAKNTQKTIILSSDLYYNDRCLCVIFCISCCFADDFGI